MYAINPELCTFCKKWAKNVPAAPSLRARGWQGSLRCERGIASTAAAARTLARPSPSAIGYKE